MIIYCDGSCLGNPGPGGWAFVCYENDKEVFYDNSGEENTTNNKMELSAAIMACEYASLRGLYKNKSTTPVKICTDSRYVQMGISTWIHQWKRNGWRGSRGEVQNKDLWMRLDKLNQHLSPQWVWVKAHSGILGNERADELAREKTPQVRHQNTISRPKIYLNVPFSQKEEAKKNGARWDNQAKQWYVFALTDQVKMWAATKD